MQLSLRGCTIKYFKGVVCSIAYFHNWLIEIVRSSFYVSIMGIIY